MVVLSRAEFAPLASKNPLPGTAPERPAGQPSRDHFVDEILRIELGAVGQDFRNESEIVR